MMTIFISGPCQTPTSPHKTIQHTMPRPGTSMNLLIRRDALLA